MPPASGSVVPAHSESSVRAMALLRRTPAASVPCSGLSAKALPLLLHPLPCPLLIRSSGATGSVALIGGGSLSSCVLSASMFDERERLHPPRRRHLRLLLPNRPPGASPRPE